ncbi:hypothetical protein LDL59_09720 [Kaistella anthropi]|nr:hypothetical protein [Kaistella anthropi]
MLTGTNKKDKFAITRLPQNETEVKIYRQKKVVKNWFLRKNIPKNKRKKFGCMDWATMINLKLMETKVIQ